MENTSDAKNERMQEGDSFTMSDIADDIIDVTAMDFSNDETWLGSLSRNVSNESINDLYAWLRTDAADCDKSQENKRSIDTRTFTRPKKRLGRLSFESVLDAPSSRRSSNVWNRQLSPNICENQDDRENAEFARLERDCLPSMLRPSMPGVSNVCSIDATLTSGHESLEAFLNMSKSKGIDSFIDLAEPEFNDDIMDVSQPSVLYSSLTSVPHDESSQVMNNSTIMHQSHISRQSGIEDSQILTDSMMQTSMFGDVVDVNLNDSFAKNTGNITVMENKNSCCSMDTTFFAGSLTNRVDTLTTLLTKDATNGTLDRSKIDKFDATYTPTHLDKTITNDDPYASFIVESYTRRGSNPKIHVDDVSFVVRPEIMKNDVPKDTSYLVRKEIANDDFPKDTSYLVRKEIVNDDVPKDTSYLVRKEIANDDVPKDTSYLVKKEIVSDASYVVNNEIVQDASFVVKNYVSRDTSFLVREETANDASFVVNNKIVEDRRSVVIEDVARDTSYIVRKEVSGDASFVVKTTKSDVPQIATLKGDAALSDKQNDTFDVKNFDATFEKTPYSSPKKSSVGSSSSLSSMTKERAINETFEAAKLELVSGKIEKEKSLDSISRGGSLDNLDSTFCKPAPKIHSKLNAPRPLSRLPQAFQKSHPNLGSNTLKLGNTRSAIPSYGFNKISRPSVSRNSENLQFSSKLMALGNIKSGSEQRLDVTRNMADLQSTGTTGGSTESIDSTQSAHSAPDFDDRLSVRSDGSNPSYSMRTLNIDEFTKIVRLREECLKQESTPKPGRRVLENNWVPKSNDLPSPILKNGPEIYGSRGSSPRSTDSTVKTSSPLLSPTGSLQNLPIDVVETNKDNIRATGIQQNKSAVPQKITQVSVKPSRNVGEHRTGLRPPASWTSANRPASGIPRPASRIPAPRFARPHTKINQGDTKK